MAGIEQRPHLELVELDPQYPVFGGASERPEPVPTGHGLAQIFRAEFRTGHILVNIDGLVTMVLFGIGWKVKRTSCKMAPVGVEWGGVSSTANYFIG